MKKKLTLRNKHAWPVRDLGIGHVVMLHGYETVEWHFDSNDIEVKVEDWQNYVTVEFLDPHPVTGQLTHGEYTYKDGTKLGLQVGQIVLAPTVYERSGARAIVRSLQPNIDPTYVTKTITRKYELRARR